MNTQGPEHERGGDAEERQRREREAALHALAGQQPPPTPSAEAPTLTRALPPMGSPRGRARPLLFALLIACVVIAGGLGWWRFSQQPHATTSGPLILKFPDAHILCPQAASWSPNGKRAIIYGDSACPNQKPSPGVLPDPQFEVYDTLTWRLTQDIHLLPLVASAKPLVVNPDLRHDQRALDQVSMGVGQPIYWLPDQRQVAIGLGASTGQLIETGGSQAQFWEGWLLLDLQTQASRVSMLRPLLATSSPPPPQDAYRPNQIARVDLIGGTESDSAVPPGLGYRWDASGHLMATEPLPAWNSTPAAPPLGPVGQPLGGASFSIWQQAIDSQATTYAYGCTAPYYPVRIQLSARSPDGRYIVEGLTLNGRFAAPADAIPPPPIDVGTPGPCPPLPTTPSDATSTAPNFVAPLPIRDAGLAAALKVFASEPFTGALNLAWSPDGTRLAVEEAVRLETPAGHLTIYDCASGKALKQYSIDRLDPGFDPVQVTPLRLSWSPDSKQLLVYDYHRLIVLRGATLGG